MQQWFYKQILGYATPKVMYEKNKRLIMPEVD